MLASDAAATYRACRECLHGGARTPSMYLLKGRRGHRGTEAPRMRTNRVPARRSPW